MSVPSNEQIIAAGIMLALGVDQVTITPEHEIALRDKVLYTKRRLDGSLVMRLADEGKDEASVHG